MYPPVFATIKAAAPVTALIGSSPVRCYPAGEAPQGVALPYVTWQTVSGYPENYLGTNPDVDNYGAQIDVWAATLSSAYAVATAVRNALQPVSYITAWRGESRDVDTNHYRYSFDVDFITSR